MSASLRTRDGSFSVAGAILASDRATTRHAQIDMAGAIAWAQANKINLKRVKRPLERINQACEKAGLPQFKIVRRKPLAEAQGNEQPKSLTPPSKPIVASQEDLLARVTDYDGALTGLVTPEIAGWLLDLNTENRPLDHKGVDRFRSILRDGKWLNTGEPVIVSREGVLNDGQHRLTAVRDGGIAAELDVRFGISRAAFVATGTGRRRTAGQVLAIQGHNHTNCQAAIARLLRHYDAVQMAQFRAQVETGEIVRIIESDERIGHIAAKLQRFKIGQARSGSFGFVLVVAARTAPMDRVLEFAALVSEGLTQDEANAGRRLHDRLLNAALKHEHISQLDVAVLAVRAWNAWVEGRSIQAFRIVESDRTSEGFPKVLEWAEGRRHRTAAASDPVETAVP
jgi:hypothetical protein